MQTLKELATAILEITRSREESWDHKEMRYMWNEDETISKFTEDKNDQAFLSCLISEYMCNNSVYRATEKQGKLFENRNSN